MVYRLINMQGRLYDQLVCRFLSPDPYVVDPTMSQMFNRYAYGNNNPLCFKDPNGE
jgi:RHS repeat-associated protein